MAAAAARPTRPRTLRALLAVGAGVVTLVLVGAACGDDDSAGSATTTAAASPEAHRATDAEVTAGLEALPALEDAAIAAMGSADADAKYEALFEQWEEIEGTVKANDADLYLSFEDELSNLKSAITDQDADKAQAAKTELANLTSQYLSAHP
jgi:hypothetical protein